MRQICHALLVLAPVCRFTFTAPANSEPLNVTDSLNDLEGRDGEDPGFPYAPLTTPFCSFWYDNDGYLNFEKFLYLVYFPLKVYSMGKYYMIRWSSRIGR